MWYELLFIEQPCVRLNLASGVIDVYMHIEKTQLNRALCIDKVSDLPHTYSLLRRKVRRFCRGVKTSPFVASHTVKLLIHFFRFKDCVAVLRQEPFSCPHTTTSAIKWAIVGNRKCRSWCMDTAGANVVYFASRMFHEFGFRHACHLPDYSLKAKREPQLAGQPDWAALIIICKKHAGCTRQRGRRQSQPPQLLGTVQVFVVTPTNYWLKPGARSGSCPHVWLSLAHDREGVVVDIAVAPMGRLT